MVTYHTTETIDAQLLREGLLTLAEAAQAIPARGGGRVAYTTVWRWITHGQTTAAGHLVRLEAIRLPRGDWATSHAAIGRFFARLNEARAQAERGPGGDGAAAKRRGAGTDGGAEESAADLWATAVLNRAGIGVPVGVGGEERTTGSAEQSADVGGRKRKRERERG